MSGAGGRTEGLPRGTLEDSPDRYGPESSLMRIQLTRRRSPRPATWARDVQGASFAGSDYVCFQVIFINKISELID